MMMKVDGRRPRLGGGLGFCSWARDCASGLLIAWGARAAVEESDLGAMATKMLCDVIFFGGPAKRAIERAPVFLIGALAAGSIHSNH